mmetsp:Transcript_37266/g.85980  ORF Transcript_37266/g.85980 Transcript_37266/m.85980 type:complete len:194 (-) Transcript_37266:103-684(-)
MSSLPTPNSTANGSSAAANGTGNGTVKGSSAASAVPNGHVGGPLAEYAALFAPSAWDALADLFEIENRKVYCIPEPSTLEVGLQAGLTALKTPLCSGIDKGQCSVDCPVCCDAGRALAAGLPYSHQAHSKLICRISGERMDENNRPMALPNGSVYSSNALKAMAAASEPGGVVTCMRTGESFDIGELRSVFII